MLFNYKSIDKLIDERKMNIIDHIDVGASAWNKSKTQVKSYTLEDIVEEFDDDQIIQRLIKWKTFLENYFNELKNSSDTVFYKIIEKKYFKKLKMKNIIEETNLTNDEIKYIDMKLKEDIVERFNEKN